ncbi:hypothetical protein AaE_002783, partial [Aphanomyces astaci]
MSTPVAADGQDVDGVAESLELWIDMLHMHRESTDLFTLSARLCKRTLATLNANKWSIDKALWRLRLLHAMMAKTAKTQWIVARVAPMTHYTKDHLHPQKAASILHALVEFTQAMMLREREKQVEAATLVQRWYRRQLALHTLQRKARRHHQAATKIQLWWVRTNRAWDLSTLWTALVIQLWDQKTQHIAAGKIQLWLRQVRAVKVEDDKAFMEPVDGRTNINMLMDGSIASTTTAWATASSSSSSTASSPSSSSSSTASSSFSSSTAPCAASSMVKRPKQPTSMPQTSSDQQSKEQRVVYDARKEDAWFRKWLNFTLLGAHYPEIIQDETSVSPDRYVQLRQLAVTRWDSKVRAAAVATYHNPQTDDILFRLQTEITACRLTIPADRPLHVDVGLQQALMDLFNSYHPLWLTLAFEVVLGIRLVESLTDVLRPSSSKLPRFLKRTILERIVQDPAFNLKTRSPKTLAQLKATTLLRCLMVVYFLDQAHVRRHVDRGT